MVERLAARARRVERDRELLLDALLADEVVEAARPERALELVVGAVLQHGRQELLAHAAFLQRLPDALLGRQVRIDLGERRSASTTE